MQTKNKRRLSLFLRHLIYASLLYYLILLILDIFSGGIVSRFIKPSLFASLFLGSAFLLSFFKEDKKQAAHKNLSKSLFYLFSFFIAAILAFSLAPHDLITASFIGAATLLLFLINQKKLLGSSS